MDLTQLRYGRRAMVEKVTDEDLSLKLFEMGMLPGEIVTLENVAPFGDPIALLLSESKICIRLQDAAFVQIKPID
jgi:ferrous iron transport protein A